MRNDMATKYSQQGVVLVIGLLMLLLITIIGVTAMSSTNSNERTAGNNQYATVSFQAAESAIKSMFSRPAVEPTIMDNADGTVDQTVTDTNAFNVELNTSAASINVQTTTLAKFCGGDPMVVNTSFTSGTQDPSGVEILAFDVNGLSVVGGVGAQENHLRSGKLGSKALGFSFNGTGTAGNCADP